MSYQRRFCEAVAERLEENETLLAAGNVTVAVEDRVSAADAVKRQLGKLGLLVLVSTTGHVRASGAGASTAGDIGLEVTVFENPKLNRATNPEAFTLTQASEVIAEALHHFRPAGMQNHIRYISMARADADENDARMVITLAALQSLSPEKAVKWGLGINTIWGEAVSSRKVRGGEPIFEPCRGGKAKFIAVRDPHWAVELTVSVQISAPEIPSLGETFEFGGLTYVTSSASVSESGEDSATVSLSGRTIES